MPRRSAAASPVNKERRGLFIEYEEYRGLTRTTRTPPPPLRAPPSRAPPAASASAASAASATDRAGDCDGSVAAISCAEASPGVANRGASSSSPLDPAAEGADDGGSAACAEGAVTSRSYGMTTVAAEEGGVLGVFSDVLGCRGRGAGADSATGGAGRKRLQKRHGDVVAPLWSVAEKKVQLPDRDFC